jgi:hypothetical protein
LATATPRRYPRLSVHVPVNCTAGEEHFRCFANTLSGGGLFLTRVEGLELGKELSLSFRPSKRLPIIQARASVRYSLADKGTAVEFTEISADDRHQLLRLIHRRTGDRRLQRRAPLATQIECDECMALAFSRDISPAGMFIETTNPLPLGSPLNVRFNLDNKDRVVSVVAEVNYVVENMGMGILFTEVEPEAYDAILEYIEKLPSLVTTPLASAKSQK